MGNEELKHMGVLSPGFLRGQLQEFICCNLVMKNLAVWRVTLFFSIVQRRVTQRRNVDLPGSFANHNLSWTNAYHLLKLNIGTSDCHVKRWYSECLCSVDCTFVFLFLSWRPLKQPGILGLTPHFFWKTDAKMVGKTSIFLVKINRRVSWWNRCRPPNGLPPFS